MSGNLPTPLGMNQTKAKLLEHLNLPPNTYELMAKETDKVYNWLTADRTNLKWNCDKDKPPYDWSDLQELSKDKAIARLATSGSAETEHFWKLGGNTPNGDNWIARWFIYHFFRHRDRRNRGASKRDEGESQRHRESSKRSNRDRSRELSSSPQGYRSNNPQQGYDAGYQESTQHESTMLPVYTAEEDSGALGSAAVHEGIDASTSEAKSSRKAHGYWDPVRDV